MPRFLLVPLLASALASGLAPAQAAVIVAVTDEAGQPLADAVVMLDATGTRPPVKPMPTVEISQSKRQFNPRVTVVTVGTPVSFPNFDTVRHHVYSFSPVKTFELKLYTGVPATPIVFDKPGAAVLGCNIHDRMAAWVVVVDTPFHARTDAQGQARLDGVPAGAYRLRAWHAGVPPGKEPAPLPLTVATDDTKAQLRLPATPL
ncbi:MAG TPA: carboxypeptidase regulatory-like domain-containing protein [Rhizobacter sp.]